MTTLTLTQHHSLPAERLRAGYVREYDRATPAPMHPVHAAQPGPALVMVKKGGVLRVQLMQSAVAERRDKGCSPAMLRMLAKISSPENASLFSKEAARKAFAHIKV